MKNFITLLVLFLFATVGSVSASVAVSAPATVTTSVVAPATTETKVETKKEKSKDLSQRQIIAAILAFFVGAFGIHNFYLGRKKQGIWQLVLTLLVITSPISAIWALVDFVRILMGKLG